METWILFIAAFVVAFAALSLPYLGSRRLTGPATIVSKRVEHGRFGGKHSTSWNYLVTFRLSDGEEIELYTFEQDYRILKDGTTGLLTWDKEHFISFEATQY